MAKKQGSKRASPASAPPAGAGGSSSRASVLNEQRALPTEVEALFDDVVSRSMQATRAEHELQMEIEKANAQFRMEQSRLMASLAERLGVTATLEQLAALRERHGAALGDVMERAQSAALAAQSAATGRPRMTPAPAANVKKRQA